MLRAARTFLFLALVTPVFICQQMQAQTTVVISLAQGNGEDAYLASGAAGNNYGAHPTMGGNTWTCGGSLCLSRGMFKFDMSAIPSNATIINASLQLFADLNWSSSPTTGGPGNSGFISRVTAPWLENSVTWSNQPPVTSMNQVTVPGSTSTAQNYTLNVTNMVQDIFWSCTNYGFKLQMQDEVNYYLSLQFASSDNLNPAKCPLLTVTYTTPTVTVAQAANGCNGLATASVLVTGSTGTNNFTWLPTTQTGSVGSLLAAGSYTVLISNSLFNCNYTYPTSIYTPSNNVSLSILNTSLCGSATASALVNSGSGNYSYLWTPGNQTTPMISSSSAGIFTVAVFDVNYNCSLSKTVAVSPLPIPNLTVSANATVCAGQSLTLNASGADTYVWFNGLPLPSIVITPSVSGSFSVTGTFTNGNCQNSKTVQVTVNANPTVTAMASKTLTCKGTNNTLTATGATTYSWNAGGLTNTLVITPTISTIYTVIGTNTLGCKSTQTVLANVSFCTGLAKFESEGRRILIYPNPSAGEFTVEANTDLVLKLLNGLGQEIQVINLNEANGQKINITGLVKGVYFIVGEKEQEGLKEKIVVVN